MKSVPSLIGSDIKQIKCVSPLFTLEKEVDCLQQPAADPFPPHPNQLNEELLCLPVSFLAAWCFLNKSRFGR